MKRVPIAALLITVLSTFGSAHAGCTTAHRGGSVGPYDTAGVTYGEIDVTAWTYGNFATGPVAVCSDGTVTTGAPSGSFTVTRNGAVVCTSTNSSFRITADPFGFGASITGTGDGCAVAISFDGITATPGAHLDDVAADTGGANAGMRKNAAVKNHGEGGTGPSTVRLGSDIIVIPNGTPGFFTKGARVQSEH